MFRHICAALILGWFLALAGCGKRAEAPAVADSDSSDHGPTTADPANGPRKTLILGAFPFTLETPESWQLKSTDEAPPLITLEGAAPSGPVVIQLTSQVPQAGDTIDVMAQAARKEADDNPDTILVFAHHLGSARVFERRVLSPYPAGSAAATTQPAGLVQWSLILYSPDGTLPHMYDPNVLIFMGLTREQYGKDHDFLEKIINSVKYTGP